MTHVKVTFTEEKKWLQEVKLSVWDVACFKEYNGYVFWKIKTIFVSTNWEVSCYMDWNDRPFYQKDLIEKQDWDQYDMM